MLIAEDLLLLLTDDHTGKNVVDGDAVELGLAGAVLLELAARGAVDVSAPGGQVAPGRVVLRPAPPTGDAVLDEALRRVGETAPRKPQDVLPRLSKDLRPALLARLTERGILRYEEGRVLGIFPTRSWPAVDSRHEHAVRAALHDVLVVGRAPDDREAALVSLLHATGSVHKVVPGAPAKVLKQRAKAVAEGGFASEAVRQAIESVNAAIVAVMITTTTAATMSST